MVQERVMARAMAMLVPLGVPIFFFRVFFWVGGGGNCCGSDAVSGVDVDVVVGFSGVVIRAKW